MTQVATADQFRQLVSAIRGIRSQMDNIRDRVSSAANLFDGRALRRTTVPLPALVVGVDQDLTFSWRTSMPSANYRLEPDMPIPAGLLWAIKGDKTVDGVIITVRATIAVNLGQSITITAWS